MSSSFGISQKLPNNEETMTVFDNELSMNKVNDTKMSDNEAFMAYMNKADEDDEWTDLIYSY